jgi:hypothetical protein
MTLPLSMTEMQASINSQDYADLTSPLTPTTSEFHDNVGIIRRSA